MLSSTTYSRSPAKNDSDIAVEMVSCALCHSSRQQARYQLRHGSIVECMNCGFNYVSPRMIGAHLRDKLQRWAVQDVVDQERLRIAFDTQTLKLYRSYINRLSAIVKPGALA